MSSQLRRNHRAMLKQHHHDSSKLHTSRQKPIPPQKEQSWLLSLLRLGQIRAFLSFQPGPQADAPLSAGRSKSLELELLVRKGCYLPEAPFLT